MTVIDDAQGQAATQGHVDSAAIGATGSVAPGSHAIATQTFTTGTAKQVSATNDAMLYITIKTAAALKIEMGPTSAAASQIQLSQSDTLGLCTLFVPGGWYVKLTGTMANLDCISHLL